MHVPHAQPSDDSVPSPVHTDGITPVDSEIETLNAEQAAPPAAINAESAIPTPIAEFLEIKVLPPGPGLPESLGWMVMVLGLHLVGGVATLLVLLAAAAVAAGSTAGLPKILQNLSPLQIFQVAAGEQLFVTMLTILLVWLRLGGQLWRRLNLSCPTLLHLVLVCAAMLPLSALCSELYRIADLGWQSFAERFPALQLFDQGSMMEAMAQLTSAAHLAVLIPVLAIGPALNEELIFRGLLGRGLTARWGWIPGVLMCSFLFGLIHVSPAHAVAVMPLGIALHYLYITTRSLWAPILLHFLNNSWATIASKYSITSESHPASAEAATPAWLLGLAALTAAALAVALWKWRIRCLRPDGSVWTPGYRSLESADAPHVRRQMAPGGSTPLVVAGLFAVLFHVLIVMTEAEQPTTPAPPAAEAPAAAQPTE